MREKRKESDNIVPKNKCIPTSWTKPEEHNLISLRFVPFNFFDLNIFQACIPITLD